MQAIGSLALSALPALPPDLSNRVADNPAAASFGKQLFHDKRLSANQQVSCATCHQPDYAFSDPLARSVGISVTRRHAPSLIGSGYSEWFYWDGRRDSLWSQALAPLEHPAEHGFSRTGTATLLASDSAYREQYTALFGAAPTTHSTNLVFANTGKAIAAFERTLLPEPTRFDAYADTLRHPQEGADDTAATLTPAELMGLDIFINKGQCLNCHNGPLLTNHGFHNIGTGLGVSENTPDDGRWQGVIEVQADLFNCLGEFSDAPADWCALTYARTTGRELLGAFKVPSLRNISRTPPYMHDGRFATLSQVIEHYVQAVPVNQGHSELLPFTLDETEHAALLSFLQTL